MIKRPDKLQLSILAVSAVFFIAANVAAQILTARGVISGELRLWPFFLTSCLCYTFPFEDPIHHNLLKTLCGGITGILGMRALIALDIFLIGLGVGEVPAICLSIAPVMALLILGGSFLPLCFNSAAFAYLIVSTIDVPTSMAQWPTYLILIVLGVLVLCLPSRLLMNAVIGRYIAKASAQSKPE